MKTRITKLTVTPGELFHEMGFEIEIVDEASGEFVEVRSNSEGHSLRIDCSEWPFLRDAIDRMFEEIAAHESEGKLKKLLETPAPWEKASEEQAKPDAEAPQGARTSEPTASEAGWIPWEGGECPVGGDTRVCVRYRLGLPDCEEPIKAGGLRWSHLDYSADIIAYKVVD